jgi:hypothetical protein
LLFGLCEPFAVAAGAAVAAVHVECVAALAETGGRCVVAAVTDGHWRGLPYRVVACTPNRRLIHQAVLSPQHELQAAYP